MTTYILLRNNKETAPLTVDEIKVLGLKSDDLVWVEGQSVCWLNPGQIADLKNLVGLPPEEVVIPQQIQEPKAKKIFVSLPVKDQVSLDSGNSKITDIENKWAGYGYSEPEPELVETKYSKQLEEIKEIYLKNLEKKNNAFQIPPQVRKAGLYASLVLTGIIAGIMIKKTGAQKETVLAASDTKSVSNEIPQTIINTDSNAVNYQDAVTDGISDQQTNEIAIDKKSIEKNKPAIRTAAEKNVVDNKMEPVPLPVTETETVAPETETKKEEERPVKKISLNEVRSQVSVKTNDYDVGSFGGIKNLKLTITNHSKYELDKVGVEVQYLKPLNELLRSEVVSVQALRPGETRVIEVKKSSRGVKVSCKVGTIKSKDFLDDTAGL